eukprot:scaffold6572_cov39-Phaeocystis_antarctica.AAC.2
MKQAGRAYMHDSVPASCQRLQPHAPPGAQPPLSSAPLPSEVPPTQRPQLPRAECGRAQAALRGSISTSWSRMCTRLSWSTPLSSRSCQRLQPHAPPARAATPFSSAAEQGPTYPTSSPFAVAPRARPR